MSGITRNYTIKSTSTVVTEDGKDLSESMGKLFENMADVVKSGDDSKLVVGDDLIIKVKNGKISITGKAVSLEFNGQVDEVRLCGDISDDVSINGEGIDFGS